MAITINGDGLIEVGGTSTTQGRVRLAEDTDNGTNYIELTAPASVAANRTMTFPDATTTVVGTDTTQTLTNKTIDGSQLVAASVTSTQMATAVQPLGVGQTWTDVKASRSSGTTYTNSTGRPIFVSIQLNCNSSGLAYAYVNLNGTDIGYLGQGSGASPNTLYSSFCTIVVPNGVTYKATITGNASFGFWFELR